MYSMPNIYQLNLCYYCLKPKAFIGSISETFTLLSWKAFIDFNLRTVAI